MSSFASVSEKKQYIIILLEQDTILVEECMHEESVNFE